MVLPSLWCTQYHQKYSAVRADTAVLFLARSRDSSAQLLDINTTSGCSPDHRHPHGFWWQHRSWTSAQPPVVVGPRTPTWPLDVAQARHHQGTRWQHRPFTSLQPLDINMVLGDGPDNRHPHGPWWLHRLHITLSQVASQDTYISLFLTKITSPVPSLPTAQENFCRSFSPIFLPHTCSSQ